MPEDTRRRRFKMGDQVMEAAMGVEGVKLVAAWTARPPFPPETRRRTTTTKTWSDMTFYLLIDDSVEPEDKVRPDQEGHGRSHPRTCPAR